MAAEVTITADKVKRQKKFYKTIKILLLFLLLFIIILYIILSVIYNGGRFTITLDHSFALEQSIVIYDDSFYKESQAKLYAGELDFMDNISIKWLPKDIDSEGDGSHNGENYIAYTFYVENRGKDIVDYWSEIVIDDVIKNVDDAVRVILYQNGEKTLYAKKSPLTNEAEKDTTPFYSEESVFIRQRKDFKPNDVDKYTIVIWLEGDDPECVDAILGGEIKMHMEIRNVHFIEEEG